MKTKIPIGKAMLLLRESHKFKIQPNGEKYILQRYRHLPEVRVFRLIFPRVMIKAQSKNEGTQFKFRLDGLGIFMLIVFTLALFLPFIPLDEGDEMDLHPVLLIGLFLYYVGFLVFEYQTSRSLLRMCLKL